MKVDIAEMPNSFIVSYENEFGDVTKHFSKQNPMAEHDAQAFAKAETEQYEACKISPVSIVTIK
jgi:hypothetical protein